MDSSHEGAVLDAFKRVLQPREESGWRIEGREAFGSHCLVAGSDGTISWFGFTLELDRIEIYRDGPETFLRGGWEAAAFGWRASPDDLERICGGRWVCMATSLLEIEDPQATPMRQAVLSSISSLSLAHLASAKVLKMHGRRAQIDCGGAIWSFSLETSTATTENFEAMRLLIAPAPSGPIPKPDRDVISVEDVRRQLPQEVRYRQGKASATSIVETPAGPAVRCDEFPTGRLNGLELERQVLALADLGLRDRIEPDSERDLFFVVCESMADAKSLQGLAEMIVGGPR